VFEKAGIWNVSWARWHWSTLSHSTSLRTPSILSWYLSLRLSGCLLFQLKNEHFLFPQLMPHIPLIVTFPWSF
jgi:hypothetical protein